MDIVVLKKKSTEPCVIYYMQSIMKKVSYIMLYSMPVNIPV